MNAQVWRLLLVCTAWSVGAVITWVVGAPELDTVVPAFFAAAAYVLTRDVAVGGRGGGGGGGNVRYWRGRRVDEPRWKRWN